MLRKSKVLYKVKIDIRLIDYLISLGYKRTKVKQLCKYRAIQVNDEGVKSIDHFLIQGDRVSINKDRIDPRVSPPLGIKIIYEDEAVIVTEKPSGLLTIASETEKTKTAYYQLNEFLKLRACGAGERIFIIHRLDKDTSGLIVFAKNEAVKQILQDSWNKVEKRYYAVVEGVPTKKQGEIMSHLRETKSLKVYSGRHSDEAKSATTKYQVLKQSHGYALLDILLVTGRKNQIRVHLADIGHPVAGDKKYGARTDPFNRLGLHSYLLSFKHPVTGNTMRFESKLPDRFRNIMLR